MLCFATLTYIFNVKFSKRNSGICHQTEEPLQMLYIVTMTYIFKREYIENGESWRNLLKYDFHIGWYVPSKGTVANVLLHDLNLHFQNQTFSYTFIKKMHRQRISPADLPRLARPPPWSCSGWNSAGKLYATSMYVSHATWTQLVGKKRSDVDVRRLFCSSTIEVNLLYCSRIINALDYYYYYEIWDRLQWRCHNLMLQGHFTKLVKTCQLASIPKEPENCLTEWLPKQYRF